MGHDAADTATRLPRPDATAKTDAEPPRTAAAGPSAELLGDLLAVMDRFVAFVRNDDAAGRVVRALGERLVDLTKPDGAEAATERPPERPASETASSETASSETASSETAASETDRLPTASSETPISSKTSGAAGKRPDGRVGMAAEGVSAEPDDLLPPLALAIAPTTLFRGGTVANGAVASGTVELEVDPKHLADPEPAGRVASVDFDRLIGHARLKAEGARWAAERERLDRDRQDRKTHISPGDHEIKDRERAAGAFLWTNRGEYSPPADLDVLDNLAQGFDNLAVALDLTRLARRRRPDANGGELDLLAEAQSAVRMGAKLAGWHKDDDLQLEVFLWLRDLAKRERHFIARHMREDDAADPTAWQSLAERLERHRGKVSTKADTDRKLRKSLKNVVHKAGTLAAGAIDEDDLVEEWQRLIGHLEKAIDAGLPPSNVEVRDALLPILDEMPDGVAWPESLALVPREIDRYLALVAEADDPRPQRPPAPELRLAADLLEGKTVYLLGGQRRPFEAQRLERDFRLGELIWHSTTEHESVSHFRPKVAKSDLVLLAIRFSSHSYGDVKKFCDEDGIPLVRLPAGYGSNRVAKEILQQCSDRL